MQRLLVEFVGSFFFFLVIAMTVPTGSIITPLGIGCVLMAMVYMGGHVSGAHYNPAVSTAVLIRGKISPGFWLGYVVTQILAGIAAFGIGFWVTGNTTAIAPSVDVPKAVVVEALFTCALCLVVLNVATIQATAGNSFYGLAIGVIFAAGIFAGGNISGGAFNPAVGIGATFVHVMQGHGSWQHLWIYIVGPLSGAVLAALLFRASMPAEREGPEGETAKG
jgi:aquaporin Z